MFCFAGAQDALDALLPHAEALIAEMRAIGGKYFILPKLEGKISIKDFVPEGSMKHLLEAEHFFQEELVMLPPNANLMWFLHRFLHISSCRLILLMRIIRVPALVDFVLRASK
jgi:hypothetical protein